VLALDRSGTIRALTRAARQALEYRAGAPIGDCFFDHVHDRHLRRVMQDLADVVCRGKRRAQWLLRLRTGHDRWRWYRVTARPRRASADGRILVRLRPL
jgi:PAS domain-containing protein